MLPTVGVDGAVDVGGGEGEQDSETLAMGAPGASDDGDVPAGAVNVRVWPVARVIVYVHVSAEADGMAPRPNMASVDPATTTAIFSLRLLDTSANSSRHVHCAMGSCRFGTAAPMGS